MCLVELNLPEVFERFLKFLLCLLWEPNDNIRRQCRPVEVFSQNGHTAAVFLCCIVPIHTIQNSVRSTLQGKMKMRTKFSDLRQPRCCLLRNNCGFERPQPYPLNPGNSGNPLNQLDQPGPFLPRTPGGFRKVYPVGRKMDAGQNNLACPLLCQVCQFLDNIVHLSGTDMSAGIWNDAIAAIHITAILNLYICAGMSLYFRQGHILRRSQLSQICNIHHRLN